MRMYDDGEKDYLYDELNSFLENHNISELMNVVQDVIGTKECRMKTDIEKEIRQEYEGYKEQVKEMRKQIKQMKDILE